jgi:hypothetical protein
MVYSKTFSRPSYPPRRVTSLSACRAAPAAARPTNDGIVEGEIAAFDGFWQGWSLAAMRPKTGEIGASRAGQWRFRWPQDVALPWRLTRTHGDRTLPVDAASRWWPRFRDQPRDAGKQIWRDGRRSHLEYGITAVADDLRADFIVSPPGDDPRGDRACPLLADVVMRF